jgi:hypothetical protein
MTIDPNEAASALGDVANVERRTREALYYGGASSILILWGVAWTIGHGITFFAPAIANAAWTLINIVGTAASLLIGYTRSHRRSRPWDWRLGGAFVVMVVFGTFTQWLLGGTQWREISVFWVVLVMASWIIAGFWIGRFFIGCGAAVVLFALADYAWGGAWFNLWMGAIGGGALVAGGFWLRRVGAVG